jgi:hypothetical protein
MQLKIAVKVISAVAGPLQPPTTSSRRDDVLRIITKTLEMLLSTVRE